MIFLKRLLRDDSGATAIEYGLIAALIAVAAVTVLGTVGGNLTATFQTVAALLAHGPGGIRAAAPPPAIRAARAISPPPFPMRVLYSKMPSALTSSLTSR